MTELQAVHPSLGESFDERVEILAKELELAIQWNRPAILLVLYNSEYVRADVESAIENFLIERHQKTACIDLNEKSGRQAIPFLKDFLNTEHVVFFVTGAKIPAMQQTTLYMELDRHRDPGTTRGDDAR